MDNSETWDKWEQLERWKTQLYQIGRSAEGETTTETELLEFWCAHLHRAAIQLSPYVHSFYVCLFEPEINESAPLHFVFGFDEGYRSETSRQPLGIGPTSLVARTGQPYVLTPQTRLYQDGGRRFGQTGRPSLSAVHLPLRQWQMNASHNEGTPNDAAQNQGEPILRGILSAQSYKASLWTRRDTPFVLDLQARADEAAHHWFNVLQKSPQPV